MTQVVGTTEIQLFHNRLTHSLKVAQIGRRLAERLVRTTSHKRLVTAGWIDPDVVEAACLAHDIGHPPFGHIAEQELQRCLGRYRVDSFEGNAQSFRIVTKLAVRSTSEPGLNLTRATLRAILKYPWDYRDRAHLPKSLSKWGAYASERNQLSHALQGYSGKLPAAEARLMDWADDVTYAVHDVEDFYRAGLIPLDRLANSRIERRNFLNYLRQRLPGQEPRLTRALDDVAGAIFPSKPYSGSRSDRAFVHDIASAMITRYMQAVTLDSNGEVLIDPDSQTEVSVLKQLTWMYVIDDPALASIQTGYRKVVRELFAELKLMCDRAWTSYQDWARLPTQLRNSVSIGRADLRGSGKTPINTNRIGARAAADYIASLTEAQAIDLYLRLTGGEFRGSVFERWIRR